MIVNQNKVEVRPKKKRACSTPDQYLGTVASWWWRSRSSCTELRADNALAYEQPESNKRKSRRNRKRKKKKEKKKIECECMKRQMHLHPSPHKPSETAMKIRPLNEGGRNRTEPRRAWSHKQGEDGRITWNEEIRRVASGFDADREREKWREKKISGERENIWMNIRDPQKRNCLQLPSVSLYCLPPSVFDPPPFRPNFSP